MQNDPSLKIGTVSGTVLSILPTITSSEILRTIVLAGVGAAASFLVSLALKSLFSKKRK